MAAAVIPWLGKEFGRLCKALGYSCAGFAAAYRTQPAFRLDVLICAALLPLVFIVGSSGVERALLFSTLVLLLFAEVLNTAIEFVVDRIGPDYHELSKHAKDLGSGAVLIACVYGGVVWLLILFDRFA
jgi:diacylglycerol kinase (ATP)